MKNISSDSNNGLDVCDVCNPPLTLKRWKSSHIAAATRKYLILPHAAIPLPQPVQGEHLLLCLKKDKRFFGLQGLAVFPIAYLHLQSPKSFKGLVKNTIW